MPLVRLWHTEAKNSLKKIHRFHHVACFLEWLFEELSTTAKRPQGAFVWLKVVGRLSMLFMLPQNH